MKGQDKTQEKQLNEVEIGNLPEKQFRIMILKMIQDLRKTMEKMQEMFTKDLQELKNRDEHYTAAAAKSLQSCLTLCDPIDGSPPAPPSLGFSRQEHWSGLPFPSPMHESEKWK